jgi:hypothetical protein
MGRTCWSFLTEWKERREPPGDSPLTAAFVSARE